MEKDTLIPYDEKQYSSCKTISADEMVLMMMVNIR